MSNGFFNRHDRSSYLGSSQIMKLTHNGIRLQKRNWNSWKGCLFAIELCKSVHLGEREVYRKPPLMYTLYTHYIDTYIYIYIYIIYTFSSLDAWGTADAYESNSLNTLKLTKLLIQLYKRYLNMFTLFFPWMTTLVKFVNKACTRYELNILTASYCT